ncbi:MAG TPA: PP2C family protein-serine/threonine phosphatase [Pyrinomonadaceae bacterium]|jgi:serine phosphatase RsbU (regulator of sigma subunit)
MSLERIESEAFQRAALKSESYRILGLLGLLGALMLYAVAHGLAVLHLRLMLAEVLLLGLAIAYKVFKLSVIRRALRGGGAVPQTTWTILGILIETQIPTIAIFLLMGSGLTSPYQALVAPVVLVYFFIIILSTLRLSPSLSFLTGLTSALGYLAVAFYAGVRYASAAASPRTPFLIYAGLILAGGIVAAFVAGQIRVHVLAALREAGLQSELERVRHDLDIARSIQQGLLPASPPLLDDFEVAGWNQPADQTGGDYFDWQALPDGRVAISLADATGHGIGPALVSASCRAYARASFLSGNGHDGVLEQLNRLLAEDLSANRFVTFAVIFLDPDSSHLEVLSAGHGPILWYRRETGRIENLEAQGIPLGMFAGIRYGRATEGQLAAGDFLALVTDGFYEWENPEGEEFGQARLEDVVRESRDLPAEEVIARLRSAVSDFCKGTEQKDDLTAVILRRKAGPMTLRQTAGMEPAFVNSLPAHGPEAPLPAAGANS